MTRKEDEEKGWFLIEDFSPENLENKEIIFKAKDLADFFSFFDKWWLQIKDKEACISHEGVSYEPQFYGKIRKKVNKIQSKKEIRVNLNKLTNLIEIALQGNEFAGSELGYDDEYSKDAKVIDDFKKLIKKD